jgi:hypothetical protein
MFLAEAGVAAETPLPFNLMAPDDQDGLFDYGRNRGVFVQQKSPPVTVPQQCWSLTKAGRELLGLVERQADPENMQLLVDILRRFGLEPLVGSWVPQEDGKCTFTADDERTGIS